MLKAMQDRAAYDLIYIIVRSLAPPDIDWENSDITLSLQFQTRLFAIFKG
jgi:hypothetical protein